MTVLQDKLDQIIEDWKNDKWVDAQKATQTLKPKEILLLVEDFNAIGVDGLKIVMWLS